MTNPSSAFSDGALPGPGGGSSDDAAGSLFRDESGRAYRTNQEIGRGVLTYVRAATLVAEPDVRAVAPSFAIKTVLSLWVGHPLAEARIARERELSTALHARAAASEIPALHCARVLGAGRQSLEAGRSRPFHVTALLSGCTLAEDLRAHTDVHQPHPSSPHLSSLHLSWPHLSWPRLSWPRLSWPRLRRTLCWADQLLSALDCLHTLGWVHRDVKPQNVFLASEGASEGASEPRAVLIDFGLAVRVGCERVDGDEPFGTPAYVAPEVIAGERLDGRADIYSLGLLLYEALAGRRPFAGRDPVQLLDAHLCEPVPPLRALDPTISPELERVIGATLMKSPGERPANAAELRALLRATPEGRGASEQPR